MALKAEEDEEEDGVQTGGAAGASVTVALAALLVVGPREGGRCVPTWWVHESNTWSALAWMACGRDEVEPLARFLMLSSRLYKACVV